MKSNKMKSVREVTSIRLLCFLMALATLVGSAGVLADELLQQPLPFASTYQQKLNNIQQQPLTNNGQEVAANSLSLLRARRASFMAVPVAQVALQSYQPRDRLALARHELSDLIMQAHRDKQAERRLMKLLINFKLASDLDDIAYPISANRVIVDDTANSIRKLQAEENATVGYPQLEELDEGAEQVADELSFAGFQLGKRKEYIKPCMFNAVSCAKNPFKKY